MSFMPLDNNFNFPPKPQCHTPNQMIGIMNATPFDNAEDVWFWFIAAQQAKTEGARVTANMGKAIRPCEPIDILKILDRLYRNRTLTMHHFKVMRHYGRRGFAPDCDHAQEQKAAQLWHDAFEQLEPIFIRKKIIKDCAEIQRSGFQNWAQEAVVYSKLQKLGQQSWR
jgi:hypothetical protein